MIIKIKEWDEMVEEYGVDIVDGEDIILTYHPFTRDMEYLCGGVFDTDSLEKYGEGYLIEAETLSSDMYTVIEDNVNHPDHYNQGEYEVIEVIKDLKKAMFYLYREIEKGEC